MTLIPHPVLVSNRTDYKEECSFSMDIDNRQRTMDKNVIVSAHFVLKSRFIERLIREERAEFCVVSRCSRTYKRNADQTTETKFRLKLPLADYADKIIVSPFIVSTKEIRSFESEEHNEEFREIPIRVPAGAILAIGHRHEFTVDSLQTVGAAICLTTNNKMEDGEYVIDVTDDYINIETNKETRKKIEKVRSVDRNTLYPNLYMSALTQAIMNFDEEADKKWRHALEKTLDKYKIKKSDLKDAPYRVAQKLLSNPLRHIIKEECND